MNALDISVLDQLRQLQDEKNPDLVAELINIYLEDAPSHIAAMRIAIEHGDADGLKRAAHALKGSSANIGAQRMAEMSSELEKCARTGLIEGAGDLFIRLEAEFALVGQELARQSGYEQNEGEIHKGACR